MVTICVIGGTLLISIGVLGEYVGKLYEQSKDRPLYLVAKTLNFEMPASSAARKQFATRDL
jgi:dolichol-phosphate mannosyltransferase